MHQRLRAVIVSAAAMSVAAASLVFATGPASSYTGTPPWTADGYDTSAKGTLSFYDVSGNQITSGSDINYIADYVMASSAPRTNATKSSFIVAAPDHANLIPSTWAFTAAQQNYLFPTAIGVPAAITDTGFPFIKLNVLGATVYDYATGLTLDTSSASYTNTIELRMKDAGVGVADDGGKYWRAVVEYNPSTALTAYDGLQPGEWRQLFPVPPVKVETTVTAPTMVLSSAPGTPVTSPAAHGTSVQLSVTVGSGDSSSPAGAVEFFDGGIDLGAGTFTLGTGVATFTFVPDDGNHSFTAQFTPTDGATYNGSSSSATTLHVNQAAPARTVSPTVTGTAKVGSTLTCTRGTWTGTGLTYRYKWFLGTSVVAFRDSGVTVLTTYTSSTLPASYATKSVKCTVYATNDGGTSSFSPVAKVVAVGSAPTIKAPSTTNRPKITGILKVTKVLTAKSGTWSPTATYTYTYVWKRYKVGKAGATVTVSTKSTYKAVAADKGKYVFVTVTAKRTGYANGVATSLPVKIA